MLSFMMAFTWKTLIWISIEYYEYAQKDPDRPDMMTVCGVCEEVRTVKCCLHIRAWVQDSQGRWAQGRLTSLAPVTGDRAMVRVDPPEHCLANSQTSDSRDAEESIFMSQLLKLKLKCAAAGGLESHTGSISLINQHNQNSLLACSSKHSQVFTSTVHPTYSVY